MLTRGQAGPWLSRWEHTSAPQLWPRAANSRQTCQSFQFFKRSQQPGFLYETSLFLSVGNKFRLKKTTQCKPTKSTFASLWIATFLLYSTLCGWRTIFLPTGVSVHPLVGELVLLDPDPARAHTHSLSNMLQR